MRVGYLRGFSVDYLHRNLHSGVLHMWVEKVVEVVVVHCCYSFQARPLHARPVLVLVSIPGPRIRLCRVWLRPWRSILPNDRERL